MIEYLQQWTPGDAVDVACLILALIFIMRGLIRGFSGELAHLMANVIVLVVAMYTYRPVASRLYKALESTQSPILMNVLLVSAYVICCALAIWILRTIFRRSIKVIVSLPTDKILGLICGVVSAAVAIFIIFAISTLIPVASVHEVMSEQSRVGRLINPVMAPVTNSIMRLPDLVVGTNTVADLPSSLMPETVVVTNSTPPSISTSPGAIQNDPARPTLER